MPKTLLRAGLFLLSVVAVLGCQSRQQDKGAPPPPPVTVARPIAYPVRDFAQYNGYLDTTQAVEIRARARGILNRVYFQEGSEVTGPRRLGVFVTVPGDKLYSIDDREYQAAVRKSEADLTKAQK